MAGISEQREVEFLLVTETRQRFFRIGARAQNGYIQLVKASFCVAKLGRFSRSTGSIGLGKEKQHHSLSRKVFQRDLASVVAL
jgi:hypothetical protein